MAGTIRLLLICLFFSVLAAGHAQPEADSLAVIQRLTDGGFENLSVTVRGDTVWVLAENRRYRFDPRGYATLAGLVMPMLKEYQVLGVVMLRRGIPSGQFTISKTTWEKGRRGDIPEKSFAGSIMVTTAMDKKVARLARTGLQRTAWNKIDLVIYPQVKIQLGNLDDPFKSQFNLAPAVELQFMRGMHFMAQVIVPLQNDLEPGGNTVRPGIVALSQTVRLPNDHYVMVSGGYFTRDRYGINAEWMKSLFNGRVLLGLTSGVTGYAGLREGRMQYGEVDLVTFFGDAAYRWSKYDLTIRAGAGRFVDGGYGWRADMSRQFREVTIGFFALQTEGFLNGGFTFRIPLPPGRYGTKGTFRVRPEDYFDYEYRAKGLSGAGKYFSSGTTLTELFYHIQPGFLQSEIAGEFIQQYMKSEKK